MLQKFKFVRVFSQADICSARWCNGQLKLMILCQLGHVYIDKLRETLGPLYLFQCEVLMDQKTLKILHTIN